MAGMKLILLGATGFVGRAAAARLVARPEVEELLLVDYDIRTAKKMAQILSPKCRWAMADVGRLPDLERLLEDVDAVAGAVGPCAEYERGILLACASRGIPAASIGDAPLPEAVRREVHDAFRRGGAAAVSGCGLMPGWTELLSAHFLPGACAPGAGERFLLWSPALFGGYAFFRRAAAARPESGLAPPGLPSGIWLREEGGLSLGLPSGRPSSLFLRVSRPLRSLGDLGRELSAAFLFWLRNRMTGAPGTPAAVAGVAKGAVLRNSDASGASSDRSEGGVALVDPAGRLASFLLAETALELARRKGEKGLLALPGIIGRETAEKIVEEGGGRIEKIV
jgi:NAD(P)-dependent dehydrogenase (short-subunit alcohol dehydrogenase family)